jgi:hypothetical protein
MHREVFLACRGLLAESIAPQCIAAGDSASGGLALSRPLRCMTVDCPSRSCVAGVPGAGLEPDLSPPIAGFARAALIGLPGCPP